MRTSFFAKPADLDIIAAVIRKALDNSRARKRQAIHNLERARRDRDPFLGPSAAIKKLKEAVDRVLETDCPILLQGETGTGKGVLARWLHQHGPRAEEAFVDVNCAGLSRELLESELFGHQKGAFTGAVVSKPGLLEVADRGTAFLDEIGDMDLLIQPKLLKVVEEQRFHRLGEVRERFVDVHVVAATYHDLAARVEAGQFRSDLYYRINTIHLRIPPLRERVEDIPIIAEQLVQWLSQDLGHGPVQLSNEAIHALQAYPWPGNIRELRNVLERAALLAVDGVIRASSLDLELIPRLSKTLPETEATLTLSELERRHIAAVLASEKGNVERAASRLGIPRSTLYSKLKQYGIGRE